MLTYDEYQNNYCGTLSVPQFEKWLVATDEIINMYELDVNVTRHRYAIYNIMDYLNETKLSKYSSESINGYSYTLSENNFTDESMIETILSRWLPSHYGIQWV